MTSNAVTIPCPNCGNQITADQRHSHMAVCDSCRSVVTFGERAAEVAGQMAVLPPPRTKLYVGAMGKFHGKDFSVLGRVRYAYQRGYWDEWYLMTGTGEPGWLTEDERHLTFETEVPNPPQLDYASWTVGQMAPPDLHLGDLQVIEKDTAVVEGGEGELPFVVVSGQRIPFLDLQGGDGGSATIEIFPDGPRVYVGRPVAGGELELQWTRQELGKADSIAVARKAEDGLRERVQALEGVRALKCNNCGGGMEVDTKDGVPAAVECPFCGTKKNLKARAEKCPQCETPVPLRSGDDAVTAVCNSCGSVSQVLSDGLKVLQFKGAEDTKPFYDPPLRLGQTFTWEGLRYQTVAWIVYSGDDGYTFEEQLLFGDEGGYLWLDFYNNHCTIGSRVFDGPRIARPADAGSTIMFRGHKFRRTEVAQAEIVHVQGELPWIAQIGDQVRYVEAVQEPYRLAGEWSPTETEWYLGRYVSREELTACTEGELNLGPTKGVLPHQPYGAGRAQAQWIWLLALLLSVGGMVWALNSGKAAATYRMANSAYQSPGGHAGEPFEASKGQIVEVRLTAPKLHQSWAFVEGNLVPAEGGKAVLSFSRKLAKFDTDERSEDIVDTSVDLRIPEDGKYRLILRAKADRVVYNVVQKDLAHTPGIRVEVVQGSHTALWFIIFAVISGFVWLYLLVDRIGFSGRKSAEEDEDDDAWFGGDDDDDDGGIWDDPWD